MLQAVLITLGLAGAAAGTGRGSPVDAAPPSPPWVEDGLWLYSSVGRRLPPERLLALAARNEAAGREVPAFYFYRKVLVEYGASHLPGIFTQAYLGMARCLAGMGRPKEAVRLLLDKAAWKRGLKDDKAVFDQLRALAGMKEVRDDAALSGRLKRILSKRGAEKVEKHGERKDEAGWSPVPEAVCREEACPPGKRPPAFSSGAAEEFGKAEFYRKRGCRKAAAVYYRYVVEKYPDTVAARKARVLLNSLEGDGE